MADFIFTNHGSLYLVEPQSAEALKHLQDHVSGEVQWMGRSLAVEPRYAANLVSELETDGWSCE